MRGLITIISWSRAHNNNNTLIGMGSMQLNCPIRCWSHASNNNPLLTANMPAFRTSCRTFLRWTECDFPAANHFTRSMSCSRVRRCTSIFQRATSTTRSLSGHKYIHRSLYLDGLEHDLLLRVAHRGRNDTISLCCQIEATASPDTVLIFMDLQCGWLAGVRRSKQIHPAIIIHIATPNEQQ